MVKLALIVAAVCAQAVTETPAPDAQAQAAPAASSAAYREEFDAGLMDPAFWTVDATGSLAVEVAEGTLRMKTPGGADARGRCTIKAQARGDFDVQVTYGLAEYTGTPDARARLTAFTADGFATVYYHRFGEHESEIIFGGSLQGASAVYHYITGTPVTGTLRLARTGVTVSASYYDGQAWRSLTTHDGLTGDAGFRIEGQVTDKFPAAQFLFDHFQLQAASLVSDLAFSAQPAAVSCREGQTGIVLNAATQGGFGPVKLEWFLDTGQGPVPVGTGPAYTLATPTLQSTGVYTCRATDAAQTITSNPARLEVTPGIAVTEQPQGAARYCDEGPLRLHVAAAGGVPPLRYTWKRDAGTGPVDAGSGDTLDVAPEAQNSGRYWCEIGDAYDTINSAPADVRFAPRMAIAVQPQNAQCLPGASGATLQFSVSGGLTPIQYTWQYAGNAGVAVAGTGETLAAPGAGVYWCEAADAREKIVSNTAAVSIVIPVPPAPANTGTIPPAAPAP